MAPEYAMAGIFSVKSDTYSYGVLLLEIVSGLKMRSPQHFPNLIDYVSTTKWFEFGLLMDSYFLI